MAAGGKPRCKLSAENAMTSYRSFIAVILSISLLLSYLLWPMPVSEELVQTSTQTHKHAKLVPASNGISDFCHSKQNRMAINTTFHTEYVVPLMTLRSALVAIMRRMQLNFTLNGGDAVAIARSNGTTTHLWWDHDIDFNLQITALVEKIPTTVINAHFWKKSSVKHKSIRAVIPSDWNYELYSKRIENELRKEVGHSNFRKTIIRCGPKMDKRIWPGRWRDDVLKTKWSAIGCGTASRPHLVDIFPTYVIREVTQEGRRGVGTLYVPHDTEWKFNEQEADMIFPAVSEEMSGLPVPRRLNKFLSTAFGENWQEEDLTESQKCIEQVKYVKRLII